MNELFLAVVLSWSPMDGDTFRILDARVWPEMKYEGRARLLRVQAPELRAKTDCERVLARFAAQYTNDKLAAGKRIVMRGNSKDDFGRVLVEVDIDGVNLNDLLLQSGGPYRPYGVKGAWC